jgi:hypothetical protein
MIVDSAPMPSAIPARFLPFSAQCAKALRKKFHVFVKCRSSNSLENSMNILLGILATAIFWVVFVAMLLI